VVFLQTPRCLSSVTGACFIGAILPTDNIAASGFRWIRIVLQPGFLAACCSFVSVALLAFNGLL